MTMGVYTVYDKIADTFSPVQCANNDGHMARNFFAMIHQQSKESEIFRGEDYECYRVGSFDTDSGLLLSQEKRVIQPYHAYNGLENNEKGGNS